MIDAPMVYVLIYLAGIIATVLGYEALIKRYEKHERESERKEIIKLVYAYKPLAADPDIRETKQGIINAITERSRSER